METLAEGGGSGSVEPSRKRPRLDDPETPESSSSDHAVRDETYYFSDGSCILKVENILFNVHRTIMSADSSTFGGMFMMPPGQGRSPEGTADVDPIILPGDSASAFRNFLWALYSLPQELTIVNTSKADLTRLIDIAHISNKYSFKTTETWALNAIQDYINQKPCPILSSIGSDTYSQGNTVLLAAQLTRLVRLAQMCNHPNLLTTLMALLRTLMSVSPEWAYLVLSLTDELSLKSLRGVAYLEVMQTDRVVLRRGDPEMVPGTLDDEERLVVTQNQQLRLLSGYFSLTTAWEVLRLQPPKFEHATGCGATWHKHGCTQSWLEFWRTKTKCDSVLAHGLADVLGRLETIIKELERWGTVPHMHPECKLAAKRSITEKINDIENQLSDIFGDEDGEND